MGSLCSLPGKPLLAYASKKPSITFPRPCSVWAQSLDSLSPPGEWSGGCGSFPSVQSFKAPPPPQTSLIHHLFFLRSLRQGSTSNPGGNAPNLPHSPQPLPVLPSPGGISQGGGKTACKPRICEVPEATPPLPKTAYRLGNLATWVPSGCGLPGPDTPPTKMKDLEMSEVLPNSWLKEAKSQRCCEKIKG